MKRIAICGALAGAMALAGGAADDAAIDFSTEERIAERYGRKGLPFVDDSKLPAERYEVRGIGPRRVVLAGSTRRARIYGLGRHLRDAAFRGGSEPVQRIRGVYLATHFGNWYVTAPEREVCDYVEDLALWGCNQIRVWFDLHDYTGVDDPRARPAIDRLRAILRAARSCGIETSLIQLSDESFSNSPVGLRADWRGGKNGYTRDLCGHYHVEICPSKPGGLELILKSRRGSARSGAMPMALRSRTWRKSPTGFPADSTAAAIEWSRQAEGPFESLATASECDYPRRLFPGERH